MNNDEEDELVKIFKLEILSGKLDCENEHYWPLIKKGKFGNVYHCTITPTQHCTITPTRHCTTTFDGAETIEVALKVLIRSKYDRDIRHLIESEIDTQSSLHHPNIVSLLAHFSSEHNNVAYLVMEYVGGGNLYDVMRETTTMKRFEPPRAMRYFEGMKCAIDFCHSSGIVHRDVKIDNVLWDAKSDTVKLADFGYAVRFYDPAETFDEWCGTLDYLSPEVVAGQPYTYMVDYWCLGVSLYEMLTGKTPFHERTYPDTMKRIAKIAFSFPDHVSMDSRNLIKKLLKAGTQMDKNGHLNE